MEKYITGIGMVTITEERISEEEVPLDILSKFADSQVESWKHEWFGKKEDK